MAFCFCPSCDYHHLIFACLPCYLARLIASIASSISVTTATCPDHCSCQRFCWSVSLLKPYLFLISSNTFLPATPAIKSGQPPPTLLRLVMETPSLRNALTISFWLLSTLIVSISRPLLPTR